MEKVKDEKIKFYRPDLMERLKVSITLSRALCKEGVLDQYYFEKLEAKPTNADKVDYILDILGKGSVKDWEAFLKCLRDDGQIDLADHLARKDLVTMSDTTAHKVLQHSDIILQRMKPTPAFLWKLRGKGIINDHEHQLLSELPTDIGKNNKILFAVQNQPISVWFQFVECLKSDGQESLAATLDTSLDKAAGRNQFLALKDMAKKYHLEVVGDVSFNYASAVAYQLEQMNPEVKELLNQQEQKVEHEPGKQTDKIIGQVLIPLETRSEHCKVNICVLHVNGEIEYKRPEKCDQDPGITLLLGKLSDSEYYPLAEIDQGQFMRRKYKEWYRSATMAGCENFNQPMEIDLTCTHVDAEVEMQTKEANRIFKQKDPEHAHVTSKSITESEVFQMDNPWKAIRKVFLEGEAGAGKTTFVQRWGYNWATRQGIKFLHKMKMVVVLQGNELRSSFEEAVKSFFPVDERDATYAIFKDNQKDCLLVIEAFDECNDEAAKQSVEQLLQDEILPHVQILLTARTNQAPLVKKKYFDKIITINGIPKKSVDLFLRKQFESHKHVESASQEKIDIIRTKLSASMLSNPLLGGFICLLWEETNMETGGGNMQDLTVTKIFKQYCNLLLNRRQIPKDILKSAADVSLRSIIQNRSTLEEKDLGERKHHFLQAGLIIKHHALLVVYREVTNYMFFHEQMREYLAAMAVVENKKEKHALILYLAGHRKFGVLKFVAGLLENEDDIKIFDCVTSLFLAKSRDCFTSKNCTKDYCPLLKASINSLVNTFNETKRLLEDIDNDKPWENLTNLKLPFDKVFTWYDHIRSKKCSYQWTQTAEDFCLGEGCREVWKETFSLLGECEKKPHDHKRILADVLPIQYNWNGELNIIQSSEDGNRIIEIFVDGGLVEIFCSEEKDASKALDHLHKATAGHTLNVPDLLYIFCENLKSPGNIYREVVDLCLSKDVSNIFFGRFSLRNSDIVNDLAENIIPEISEEQKEILNLITMDDIEITVHGLVLGFHLDHCQWEFLHVNGQNYNGIYTLGCSRDIINEQSDQALIFLPRKSLKEKDNKILVDDNSGYFIYANSYTGISGVKDNTIICNSVSDALKSLNVGIHEHVHKLSIDMYESHDIENTERKMQHDAENLAKQDRFRQKIHDMLVSGLKELTLRVNSVQQIIGLLPDDCPDLCVTLDFLKHPSEQEWEKVLKDLMTKNVRELTLTKRFQSFDMTSLIKPLSSFLHGENKVRTFCIQQGTVISSSLVQVVCADQKKKVKLAKVSVTDINEPEQLKSILTMNAHNMSFHAGPSFVDQHQEKNKPDFNDLLKSNWSICAATPSTIHLYGTILSPMVCQNLLSNEIYKLPSCLSTTHSEFIINNLLPELKKVAKHDSRSLLVSLIVHDQILKSFHHHLHVGDVYTLVYPHLEILFHNVMLYIPSVLTECGGKDKNIILDKETKTFTLTSVTLHNEELIAEVKANNLEDALGGLRHLKDQSPKKIILWFGNSEPAEAQPGHTDIKMDFQKALRVLTDDALQNITVNIEEVEQIIGLIPDDCLDLCVTLLFLKQPSEEEWEKVLENLNTKNVRNLTLTTRCQYFNMKSLIKPLASFLQGENKVGTLCIQQGTVTSALLAEVFSADKKNKLELSMLSVTDINKPEHLKSILTKNKKGMSLHAGPSFQEKIKPGDCNDLLKSNWSGCLATPSTIHLYGTILSPMVCQNLLSNEIYKLPSCLSTTHSEFIINNLLPELKKVAKHDSRSLLVSLIVHDQILKSFHHHLHVGDVYTLVYPHLEILFHNVMLYIPSVLTECGGKDKNIILDKETKTFTLTSVTLHNEELIAEVKANNLEDALGGLRHLKDQSPKKIILWFGNSEPAEAQPGHTDIKMDFQKALRVLTDDALQNITVNIEEVEQIIGLIPDDCLDLCVTLLFLKQPSEEEWEKVLENLNTKNVRNLTLTTRCQYFNMKSLIKPLASFLQGENKVGTLCIQQGTVTSALLAEVFSADKKNKLELSMLSVTDINKPEHLKSILTKNKKGMSLHAGPSFQEKIKPGDCNDLLKSNWSGCLATPSTIHLYGTILSPMVCQNLLSNEIYKLPSCLSTTHSEFIINNLLPELKKVAKHDSRSLLVSLIVHDQILKSFHHHLHVGDVYTLVYPHLEILFHNVMLYIPSVLTEYEGKDENIILDKETKTFTHTTVTLHNDEPIAEVKASNKEGAVSGLWYLKDQSPKKITLWLGNRETARSQLGNDGIKLNFQWTLKILTYYALQDLVVQLENVQQIIGLIPNDCPGLCVTLNFLKLPLEEEWNEVLRDLTTKSIRNKKIVRRNQQIEFEMTNMVKQSTSFVQES